ncbi:hypothetical protein [Hymenobacter cellulosilyticus]|uniref:DUF4397 domain-containing protein n=1 Tax=Hymenobacter cellulosilyticus TaxID=2932248 RepID=A0A8T9Q9V4_9BACT|nr:hypothetical protein [Hymenobacter cellulosilyticus]UOQ73201.1 hypothetical protein MUN79_04310 [Hymenobacter cellulosilyticus]
MKHLFALLLAAGTVALPACSDTSDGDDPVPAAETRMDRELRYPLTPPAANGDTVLVLANGYPAEVIKATAIGPGATWSSYMGLQIVLEVPSQAEQVRIMIPDAKLSPSLTGQYFFDLYKTKRNSAGGSYVVGSAATRPLIDTYFNALSNGSISIDKYDPKTKLISGWFYLQQASVSDPGALAGLGEPLRKKCTVVLKGSFANVPVQ